MTEITGTYRGDLRVEARHGPSGATLVTDAPPDNGGEGRWFSPTDLVATALGTCVLTVMGLVASRRGVNLTGARWTVAKEMIADPKRRIARLAVTVWLPAAIVPSDREVLERAAHACPVHNSLDPRVAVTIDLRYE